MSEYDLLVFLINQLGYAKVLNTVKQILSDELKIRLEWSAYGK